MHDLRSAVAFSKISMKRPPLAGAIVRDAQPIRRSAPRPSRGSSPVSIDMSRTCTHVRHMPKMIQIRHVPDALHRKLKVRAAEADMTLSDYIKRELEQMAARPTLAQIAARLKELEPVELDESVVDTLRDARNSR